MSISSFRQFLIEEKKTIYFTFGRMNPPTAGHGVVFDRLAEEAGKSPFKIFLSPSHDDKKNPLLYESKIKYARKMFPCYGRAIIKNDKIKNILEAASHLYDEGYTNAVVVVGEDRKLEFDARLNKYNGVEGTHGFYNFKSIKVISAGKRIPGSSLVEGISASQLREAAASNDFISFSQGVTRGLTNDDTKKLFNEVRKGMGLKETVKFKNHIEIEPISETREKYVEGELFNVGDQVVIKENDEVATVKVLGANYIIVETSDGTKKRKWLDAVEKLN